jgi:hypothetical protein
MFSVRAGARESKDFGTATLVKRYTGLTGKDANFLGIRFMHLRLPRKNPFEPPVLEEPIFAKGAPLV